jgi:Ca2+-binding RTX toxin-like protein
MTTNSKIYIASKSVIIGGVDTGKQHLYLVYDEDGNLGTLEDQKVIRGGLNTAQSSMGTNLVLEVGVQIQSSLDRYETNDTPLSRGTLELNVPNMSAHDVWVKMMSFANSLGDIISGTTYTEGTARDTNLYYDYTASDGFNSNSTIASILSHVGIRMEDVFPLNGETLLSTDHFYAFDFPNYNNLYGGSLSDTFLVDSAVKSINGRDGNDTADFSGTFTAFDINLATEEFYSDITSGTIQNIENVIGTNYNDIINGDANNNILDGKSGVDTIYGGAGDDTLIFRAVDNSFFAPTNEKLYGGTGGTDTLQLEFTNSELTNALKDEILDLYYEWTVINTSSDKAYDFNILRLQVYEFEALKVLVDGQLRDLSTTAYNDQLMMTKDTTLIGNLLADNGYGADYTFGSTLLATAGTFGTVSGGTITITNDGAFSFLSAVNFTGVDEFTYTITDSAGYTKTATAYFNVQDYHEGTALGETMDYRYWSTPVFINAGDGADTVRGSSYADRLDGGNGNDSLYGENGDDYLYGGTGNDSLSGGNGNDHLYGDEGGDWIFGGAGNDHLLGGDGNDTLMGGSGTDYYDGGDGIDTLSFSTNDILLTHGIHIDLSINKIYDDGHGNVETVLNVEHVSGTEFDDIIVGNALNNTLYGGAGNDVINGGDGQDIIDGGDGDDLIYSGSGIGTYYGGFGNDTFIHVVTVHPYNTGSFYGGDGNDTIKIYVDSPRTALQWQELVYLGIHATNSSVQNAISLYSIENVEIYQGDALVSMQVEARQDNFISGNTSSLTGNLLSDNGHGADYSISETYNVTAGTFTTTAGGSVVIQSNGNFAYTALVGYLGADSFDYTLSDGYNYSTAVGTANIDVRSIINGTSGNDANLTGTSGNDFIYGFDGNDTLRSSEGIDYYDGGNGIDLISFATAAHGAHIDLSANKIYDDGYGNIEDIINIEDVEGTAYDDLIIGNALNNVFYGAGGNNTIYGGAGNDTFFTGVGNDIAYGEAGDDNISGGAGDDILSGGDGYDILRGGPGSDTFVFEADTVFNNIDNIADFNRSQGDKLDISDVLIGYNPVSSDINDYLSVVSNSTTTKTLYIDRDGSGTDYISQAAILFTGANSISTVNDLLNNGHLIL